MVMTALREGASGGVLKFFLFGLLALAAGGLVFTDVGGFFRGGVGGTDIAKVAGQSVSINRFDRIARRTLQPLQITPQQAYKFGYLREILNSELRRRILIADAHDKNITIGKEQIIGQIKEIIAPAVQNGLSPEQALETLLRNQGMSEGELSATITSERALALLNSALQAGTLYAPKALQNTIYDFENETRDIRYITFLNKDFKNINTATDEQLTALYEATKEAYAIPQRRSLQIIRLKTAALKDTLEISEESLKAAYDENIEDFSTPESRKIVQAIAATKEDATAIYDAAKKSGALKAAAAKTGDYIPAKTFTEDNILAEIKEIVFSAKSKTVLEPVETPLGWSVIKIESITPAKVTSFEKAKKSLREDLIEDRLIDELYTIVDDIDDAFASGADVAETANQFGLSISEVNDINAYGQNAKRKTPLKKILGDDAQSTLETAFKLESGETGTMNELKNGDFIAIHAKSVTPKSYKPFNDVKTAIQTKWNNDQKTLGNKSLVSDILKSDGQDLTAAAKAQGKTVKTAKTLTRKSTPKAPLGARALSAAFKAPANTLFLLDIEGGFALAEVTRTALPVKSAKRKDATLKEIQDKALKDIQNEIFATYVGQKSEKYGAKINEALLERAYGSESESVR